MQCPGLCLKVSKSNMWKVCLFTNRLNLTYGPPVRQYKLQHWIAVSTGEVALNACAYDELTSFLPVSD